MNNNPVTALMLALGIILFAARMGGEIARKFDQPRVLGELLIGVILGPTLLNMLHSSALGLADAHLDATIIELAELGVMLLMFKVGLEVNVGELMKVGVVAGIAGAAGAVVPVLMVLPAVMLFGYSWQPALFAGVTLAATSVSISAQVLLELGLLQTKEGNALLATALIDDVIAILLVSLTVAITGTGGSVDAGSLINIILRMAGYLVIAFVVAWFGLPVLMQWLNRWFDLSKAYGNAAVGLVMALVFGWAAQSFGGVAAITGAFIAGVGLSRAQRQIKHQIEESVDAIAYAFLVPIFFVSVGLQTDLSDFPLNAIPLAVVLLVLAVVSKLVGCGVGARLGGFDKAQSLRLGVCMISRGEVGLIIAALGLSSGILTLDDPLFLCLFLVILLTTVVTPPLVRRVFNSAGQGAKGT
ncbi:MAG: cation:proton antiporter [Chloroflexi bacterium]|nr:cation:proton antiporter [Chloroflexota bacterium]